jgi:hypothetical protein
MTEKKKMIAGTITMERETGQEPPCKIYYIVERNRIPNYQKARELLQNWFQVQD